MPADTPLLETRNLTKHFPVGGGLFGSGRKVHALEDVSISLAPRETLSVVGESGSGKTTLGRVIMGLTPPTSGEVHMAGQRIDTLSKRRFRAIRKDLQLIFQDPFSSLNPRLRVRDIIGEPLVNFGLAHSRREVDERVAELLDQVRLPQDAAGRHPHEFSGGQRQRIAIARALAPGARVIVCDEAVSALDVSVKAQIINLLRDLQDRLSLTMLFISHDMAIVEHLTHRVAVMYLGQIIEIADRRTLFGRPAHPYTQALLSAVPVPDPARRNTRIVLKGDIPSPITPPSGCRFHTRCPLVMDRCRSEAPLLRPRADTGHAAACHLDALPAPRA